MLFEQEGLAIQSGFQRIEALSFKGTIPGGARFLSQAGAFEISFFAKDILRLRLETHSAPDYGLLVGEPQDIPVQISQSNDACRLTHDETSLELTSGPLRFRLWHRGKVILESTNDRAITGDLRIAPFAIGSDEWLLSLGLHSDEAVFGLGEKFGPLNRRGQLISNWNQDATGVNAEASYKNTPFAWSPCGWGLLVHTPARVTHGVGYPQWSHRSYILKLHDSNLDLFFFAADSPAEMLEKYTWLTGRAPHVPRWSYGVWMGRAYYQTAQEALEVVRKLRQHQIPVDVLLLDGRAWHRMDTRFDFSWDPQRYPDPAGFVQQMKDMNVRLCLWEYPYLSTRNPLFNELAEKGYLLKEARGKPYVYKWFPEPFDSVWPHLMPSGMIDFTNPEAYAWYRDQHKLLHDIGIAVMKTDYGEAVPEDAVASNGDTGKRLHNVYTFLYNRCVYEASQKYMEGEGMVWGRSSWTGSQRFPIQWGGDPQCDWEGLAASIRGGLSWGLSGAAYYTHDIGGFAIGQPPAELYIRWTQAGVMSSHTRFHGIGRREPWEFGEQAEKIVKDWLAWRYRLIPYLQACALEANRTGLPLMRAMPLAFPHDPVAWGFEHQYLFGPSLLVAPVLEAGGTVRLYLPDGNWYDIWSGNQLQGPQVLELSVPLERIPIYGRQGYLLPLGPAVQHTGELKPVTQLEEVWVFGPPQVGVEFPDGRITVHVQAGKTRVSGLSSGVTLTPLGDIQLNRDGQDFILADE